MDETGWLRHSNEVVLIIITSVFVSKINIVIQMKWF